MNKINTAIIVKFIVGIVLFLCVGCGPSAEEKARNEARMEAISNQAAHTNAKKAADNKRVAEVRERLEKVRSREDTKIQEGYKASDYNASNRTENKSEYRQTTVQSGPPDWIQGHWRLVNAYGAINVYVRGRNMTVYLDGECVFDGPYRYDDGSSYSDGRPRLIYDDFFVLINRNEKRLYADDRRPFKKVY